MLAKEQSNKGCFSEVSEYSGAQHHGVIDKEEVRRVVCQHLGLEVVGRVELVKQRVGEVCQEVEKRGKRREEEKDYGERRRLRGILKCFKRNWNGKNGGSRLKVLGSDFKGKRGLREKPVKRVTFALPQAREEAGMTKVVETAEQYWNWILQASRRQQLSCEGKEERVRTLELPKEKRKGEQGCVKIGDRFRMMKSLMVSGVLRGKGMRKWVPVIVDTGAATTLIKYENVKQLKWKLGNSEELYRLQGPSGERLKVKGVTEIEFEMGNSHFKCFALAVEGLSTECLLGMDFLSQAKAQLCFETGVMTILGAKPIHVQWGVDKEGRHGVRVKEKVLIPAGHAAAVPVRVVAELAGTEGAVQAIMEESRVLVATTLGKVGKGGQTMCQVVNASREGVWLGKGETIGRWESFED